MLGSSSANDGQNDGSGGSHRAGELKELVFAWLGNEFRKRGYTVVRDYVVESGGVKHRFDLLAEQEVVPGLRIVVGVVFVNNGSRGSINADVVERYIAWKELLPLDSVTLVTMGEVTPEAMELAARFGIDIVVVGEDLLSRLRSEIRVPEALEGYYHVKHVLDLRRVVEFAEEGSEFLFLRKSKTRASSVGLVYVPLIVGEVEVSRSGAASEEIEIFRGKIVVDGVRGYLISLSGNTIDVNEDVGNLLEDLTDRAIDVLDVVSSESVANIASLGSRLEMDFDEIKKILDALSSKGLVDVYGDVVEFKGFDPKAFIDLEGFAAKNGGEILRGPPPRDEKGIAELSVRVQLSKFERLLKSCRCKPLRIYVVYYPLYVIFLSEEDEERREKVAVIDAVTGEEVERLARQLFDLDTIEYVRSRSLDASSFKSE